MTTVPKRHPAPGLWPRFGAAALLAFALATPESLAQDQPPPGSAPAPQQGDPPARVGRLSYVYGTVSFHAQDQEQWNPAVLNYPVTAGDSFWTEPNSRAVIDVGRARIALDQSTQLDVLRLDDQVLQVNVAQGDVHLRLGNVEQGEIYEIATPSGTVQALASGSYRIDAGHDGQPAQISVFSGAAGLVGQGEPVMFNAGQAGPILADAPPPQMIAAAPIEIDNWSEQSAAPPAPVPYVSPEMPGASDLAATGEWQQSPEYGAVWYPPVAADWAPYRYGHWAYVAPWGWTWIDDAPWGFAPFHYGRWVEVGPRWAWVPGTYIARPIYAPALVAFVGGAGFAAGIAIGGPAIGWVPLGPREIYVPPYHTSIAYVREVNVTHVTNVTVINETVINRTREAKSFANYRSATVVSAAAMTGSRPIAAASIHVAPERLAAAPAVMHREPARPSLATSGASPATVRAAGGNLAAKPSHAAAPGPMVDGRPRFTPASTGTPASAGAPSHANTGNRPTQGGATNAPPHAPGPPIRNATTATPPHQALHNAPPPNQLHNDAPPLANPAARTPPSSVQPGAGNRSVVTPATTATPPAGNAPHPPNAHPPTTPATTATPPSGNAPHPPNAHPPTMPATTATPPSGNAPHPPTIVRPATPPAGNVVNGGAPGGNHAPGGNAPRPVAAPHAPNPPHPPTPPNAQAPQHGGKPPEPKKNEGCDPQKQHC